MGVSDEAKNVIPLKFLRKIKNKFFFPSCKLNPGTYCILLDEISNVPPDGEASGPEAAGETPLCSDQETARWGSSN
jgi:hypothetical protein